VERQVFVARDRELEQLAGFLDCALAGQGTVCFVTGEAGSGKTALAAEFARRAQEQHKDLVVAVGQSDAQTGAGDAYLPFREVLSQLTGDVEAELARGAITQENAGRLRGLLRLSGQALVEVGPDLVGIFVPGAGLAMRVGGFVAEKVGWLEKLEQLTQRQREGEAAADSGIEQSHIFEQYTNVLKALAAKQPLMLVLDDLQWADGASIDLLFRLGRRIGESRILIVGTYRPDEVALGRSSTSSGQVERHPLEKVLAEFKRYFGDVRVDLAEAQEAEGEQFVDVLVDTEPNRLGGGFRQALYHHTGGHPLFTIELLRNMQERGDLVQDEGGRWTEGPVLDWEELPARVEGVIEERIGRLERELREALTVASVEGEDFTAEVAAHVQETDARGLIRRLSGEVEKQHRLVSARGVQRLDGQRLSLYRFQHNLFQTYLYNELDEVERVCLHEDVGRVLEELYGDQVDAIAVQLARHYVEAGIVEKARVYLRRAGELAAARYANDEAVAYFSRALDLTSESRPDECYTLLLAREKIWSLKGAREAQAQDLTTLEELAEALDGDQRRAEVALRQARYASFTSDYLAAIAAAQEAIRLAQAVQDPSIQAVGHFQWGTAAKNQGDYETARCQLEQGMALSRAAGMRQVEADCLRVLGVLSLEQGDYDKAKTYYEESLRISCEEGDRRSESKTLNNLGNVFAYQGDWTSARSYHKQALAVFRETGDRRSEAVLLGNLGINAGLQGDLQAARAYYEQARLTSHEVGDRDGESRMLCALGSVSGSLGDLAAARCFLEQALLLVREIGRSPEEATILLILGFTLAMQGDYPAAGECCGQSLRLARELGARQAEANALGRLGVVCDCVGDYSGARDRYHAALQIARSMGYQKGENEVLANLGLLYHHLGEDQAAREYGQRALEMAQELGARTIEASAVTHLGHALAGLGDMDLAASSYAQALILRRELAQAHLAAEALAGLARVSLAQNDLAQAQTHVEQILGFLEDNSLDGTEEPFRIYLTCYLVLRANQDPRAQVLLTTAHNLLQGQAAKIEDEGMRRSFLENVAAHQEIVREFERTQ
jgi:adenylate cyclase